MSSSAARMVGEPMTPHARLCGNDSTACGRQGRRARLVRGAARYSRRVQPSPCAAGSSPAFLHSPTCSFQGSTGHRCRGDQAFSLRAARPYRRGSLETIRASDHTPLYPGRRICRTLSDSGLCSVRSSTSTQRRSSFPTDRGCDVSRPSSFRASSIRSFASLHFARDASAFRAMPRRSTETTISPYRGSAYLARAESPSGGQMFAPLYRSLPLVDCKS